MDLNELLYAHQVAVMKASASGDDDHIGKIAEYADRIRQLRILSDATSIAPDPCAPPTIIYGSYAGDPRPDSGAVSLLLPADGFAVEQNENPDRGKAHL